MSAASVTDGDVEQLATDGVVLLRSALRFVFSPEEELNATAAIAARLLDERATCVVGGPQGLRSPFCELPLHPNGLVGIALNSADSCERCDSSIGGSQDFPPYAAAKLQMLVASAEALSSGDVLAFLGGNVLPQETGTRIWWFAPTPPYGWAHAQHIDQLFESRPEGPKAAIMDHAANEPFITRDDDGVRRIPERPSGLSWSCNTGPLCWIHADAPCMCKLESG